MKVSTIITLIVLPTMTLAQEVIIGKFVDKSYGTKYLDFRADFTFTFEIGIHLEHDIACGTYKILNDTIYLSYKYDMTDTSCNVNQINVKEKTTSGKYDLIIEPETDWRPDTLFYNDNRLYEIKNSKIKTKTTKFQVKANGNKPEGTRRKYVIFGPYIYKKRATFYMEKVKQ